MRVTISAAVQTSSELMSEVPRALRRIVILMNRSRLEKTSLNQILLKVLPIKFLKSTDGQGLEVMIA